MRHLTRRQTMTTALASLAAAGAGTMVRAQGSGRLVACLSRSGNTRVLAGALSRQFGADLFELRPATPWPEDYEQMVVWASDLRAQGAEVPLAQDVGDLGRYRTVFVGFPIWGGAMPAVMSSFLGTKDLAGKTVLPFITHGGYGEGSAMQTLREHATGAQVLPPFVLECDQERDTLQRLGGWLDDVGAPL